MLEICLSSPQRLNENLKADHGPPASVTEGGQVGTCPLDPYLERRQLRPPPPGPPQTEAWSLWCSTKPQRNSWPLQPLTSRAPGKGGKRPEKELGLGQGVNVSISLHRCLFGHFPHLSSPETPLAAGSLERGGHRDLCTGPRTPTPGIRRGREQGASKPRLKPGRRSSQTFPGAPEIPAPEEPFWCLFPWNP